MDKDYSHQSLQSLRGKPIGFIPESLLDFKMGEDTDSDTVAETPLAKMAEQILADPIAMRRLSERVIDIMTFDLQQQCERGNQHGPW